MRIYPEYQVKITGKVSLATVKSRLSIMYYEFVMQSIHRVSIGEAQKPLMQIQGTRATILSRLSQTCTWLVGSFSFSLFALERTPPGREAGETRFPCLPLRKRSTGSLLLQRGPCWGPDSRAETAAQCWSTNRSCSSLLVVLSQCIQQPSFIRKSAETARVGVAVSQSLARDREVTCGTCCTSEISCPSRSNGCNLWLLLYINCTNFEWTSNLEI